MRIKMKETYNWWKCIFKCVTAVAAVLLSIAAVAAFGGVTAWADEPEHHEEGGIVWWIDGTTLHVAPNENTAAGSTKGEVGDYGSCPANAASSSAPGWKTVFEGVTDIVIEDGVTRVGTRAFGGYVSNGSIKEINSVTIGKDVKTIDYTAFGFLNIKNLTIYSKDVSISPKAFWIRLDNNGNMSSGGSDIRLGVDTVNCFGGSVAEYFSKFRTAGEDGKIALEGVTYSSQWTGTLNLFNVNVVSDNLLDSGAKVLINWADVDEQEALVSDEKFATAPSTMEAFMSDGRALNKLKFFDLSRTDDGVGEYPTVKVPVPSAWSEHSDTIQVLVYKSDGTIEQLSSSIVGEDDATKYIQFTMSVNRPYALYYSYDNTPAPATKYEVDLNATFDGFYGYNTSGSGATYDKQGELTTTDKNNLINKFSQANTDNKQGYQIDTDHLYVFDLSLKVDGETVTTNDDGVLVTVPVPAAWVSSLDKVQVLTITDGKVTPMTSLSRYTDSTGAAYVQFTPPHFSPYALYLDDTSLVGSTTTTTTTAAANQTTASDNGTTAANNTATTTAAGNTTATTTKTAAVASNTNNTVGGGSSGSGVKDNTPITGIKDVMWFAIPLAVLLLGVGVVILAQRKRKVAEE